MEKEVIDSLIAIKDLADLKEFFCVIRHFVEDPMLGSMRSEKNEVMWTSLVKGGANLLKFVNYHTEKIKDKKESLSSKNDRAVAEILEKIGEVHWVFGALSILAFFMEKYQKVRANKEKALQLLDNMVDLAETIAGIREDLIPEVKEKVKKAVKFIVKGSIMCVSQICSDKFSSCLKATGNSENLESLSEALSHLYFDLNLAITIANANRTAEMERRQPIRLPELKPSYPEDAVGIENAREEEIKRQHIRLPELKPFYPKDAVGIENAIEEVIKLLNMTSEDESTVAMVIYGFGGMGKTTLATAVVAMLNLNGYNYVRVNLDQKMSKNDLKEKQQQILADAFPNFEEGQSIKLRDCQEGRHRLVEAFRCVKKPVFIFIDNVLRSEDLKELLPEDLRDFPKGSKILLTTRRLDATDVVINFPNFKRVAFKMNGLDKENAIELLCKNPDHQERIKADMDRILQICGGVPLVLKIVRGHLIKMGYDSRKCSQILNCLEKGANVKEENLNERLVEFV